MKCYSLPKAENAIEKQVLHDTLQVTVFTNIFKILNHCYCEEVLECVEQRLFKYCIHIMQIFICVLGVK